MRRLTKLTLFLMVFLVSCASPAPEPTVTVVPSSTQTPQSTRTSTPTLTPSPTETPFPPTVTPAPTNIAYTPDQLAAMTPDQMIAAANEGVQLPEGATLENTDVRVEAGHVVTYWQNGEHVAVMNLLTGETHDQMGVIEYGGGIYQRVFYDNNWDYEGYTPSLEERGMLKEQIATMVEGEFAVNWALREGLYSSDGQTVRITGRDPLSLNTTAKRLAFFKNVILPKYRQAVASGAIFEDGSVIPLDGGLQFRTQLPEVVVEFGYNPDNSMVISTVDGKDIIPVDSYSWVEQRYEEDSNTLTITIGMDAKLARMSQEQLVGGAILGSVRSAAFDDLTESGIGDMSGMPLLDALGVPNLGPDRESSRYGSLNPSNIVQRTFEGLEPIMYNRQK